MISVEPINHDFPKANDFHGQRLFAVDYGRRRVGTAVCDELHITVSAREVLQRDHPDFWEQLLRLIEKERAAAIIVGVPYRHDGQTTSLLREIERFMTEAARRSAKPVIPVDESYSSRQGVQAMIAAGVKKQKRAQKGAADAVAATLILREYLNQP